MSEGKIVELDVREDLKNKVEPFQKIMEAIKSLGPDDTFVLHATFKPVPLFSVLNGKGFDNEAEKIDQDHWKITFTRKG